MIVTPRQAIVSAVLFGFHGINLFKNLVSRELLRILENFHFSISISKHFDFTFHFSKKSESILISLCTSRKRVKAFFFHFALLEKEWKLFIFTFHFSNFKNPLSLVPAFFTLWNLRYFGYYLFFGGRDYGVFYLKCPDVRSGIPDILSFPNYWAYPKCLVYPIYGVISDILGYPLPDDFQN